MQSGYQMSSSKPRRVPGTINPFWSQFSQYPTRHSYNNGTILLYYPSTYNSSNGISYPLNGRIIGACPMGPCAIGGPFSTKR